MSLQQLRNITKDEIKRSKNSPPTNINKSAKVVKVHDGDTCDLVIIRNRNLQRFKCRLAGIDTPEMNTGRKAEKARDFLAWLSIGEDPADFPRRTKPWSKEELQERLDANKMLVHAEFEGVGYYGRPLVILRKTGEDDDSFNDLLMQYDYAQPYRK